jgi:hypothetical protein
MTVTPQSRFYMTKKLLVDVSDIVSIWGDPDSDTSNVRIAYRSASSIWVDRDTANEIAEAVLAYESYTHARNADWWNAAAQGVCEDVAK